MLVAADRRADLLDRIVAVVENEAITQRELAENIQRMKIMLAQQNPNNQPSNDKKLVAEVLQQLISKHLQLQEAKRLKIEIDDISITRAVKQIAENNKISLLEMEAQLRERGQTIEMFRQQVREQLTIQRLMQREVVDKIDISDEEIQRYLLEKSDSIKQHNEYHLARWSAPVPPQNRQKIYQKMAVHLKNTLNEENISSFEHLAYRSKNVWKQAWAKYFYKHRKGKEKVRLPKYTLDDLGWKTIDAFSTQLRQAILKTQLRTATALINADDKVSYLFVLGIRNKEHSTSEKQYKVRHILLQPNPLEDDQLVKQHLQKIKAIVLKKNNFAEFAKKYSKDPGSSFKGGDLGWSNLQQFVPPFREAALQAAASKEIVGPVQTQFGWHLIEVTAQRDSDIGGQVAHEEAFAQIRRSKFQKAKSLWLINLREKSHIEIFL